MDAPPNSSDAGPEADTTDYLIERASVSIGRLDALVSASFVARAWTLRASWTGYARALRLQGVEIDDIDVFSWGSGVIVPGRPRFQTTIDHFAAFAPWRNQLDQIGRHWAEELPFRVTPVPVRSRLPVLRRALDLLTAFLQADPSIMAWLALPVLLHRLGLTEAPLPCLVAGDRQLLNASRERDRGAAVRRILRSLEAAAIAGRQSLKAIEDARAVSIVALVRERRPSSLARLATLLMVAPVQSPEAVARRLKLTLSGAGKLLARAAAVGLVVEVSGRLAWRVYVVPDLAITLGFVAAPKGRPALRPGLPLPDRDLADILAQFDSELAAFDSRFPSASE
ncbi:hypothetical protein U1763_20375 [Sphingomonas sp. LB2R24]|uniref:hypothetical protein n=1 Tax=Sphingomonas sorbitolis TaxID=3096165 RepID=UPI002FCB0AF1